MEKLTILTIVNISTLDIGLYIDNPEKKYYVCEIFLFKVNAKIFITRRSLKHILEKNDIGFYLSFILKEILMSDFSVYESKKPNRYILTNHYSKKIVAIIIEKVNSEHLVVTSMISTENYLKKFTRLR